MVILNQLLTHYTKPTQQTFKLLLIVMSIHTVFYLSGCAIKPDTIAKQQILKLSETDIEDSFTKTLTSSPSDQVWWKAWQDPQLNQWMDSLDASAPSIQIVKARLNKALSLSDLSQTNNQIQGNIQSNITADRFPDHFTYSDKYAGETGSSGNILLSLRWHLDLWGKWKALNHGNKANVNAALYSIKDARLSLQVAITNYYVKWYFATQLLQNQQQQVIILKRLLGISERKKLAGLATQTELLQSQLELLTFQQQIPETERKISSYQHIIASLLGKTPNTKNVLFSPQLKLESGLKVIVPLPLELIGQRPDIVAQRQHVEALSSYIAMARASFYPDIDLNALAGFQSLSLGHLLKAGSRTASIGPAISLPLFEQNRLTAELRGRVADYDEAVAQYNQRLLVAIQETTDCLQKLKVLTQQNLINNRAVDEARELSRIQYQLVSKGLTTQQQLLQAELVKLQQQNNLIQTNQQMIIAQVELTYLLGGYWAFSSPLKVE